MLNPETIKKDFPIFSREPKLVYLDSAATSLKPTSVIAAEREYEERFSANIARGLYPIAETATERFEAARDAVARFINAESREIIFTQNTTDSLNMAADLLAHTLKTGEKILVTEMEHHSNYLPWKELAARKQTSLDVIPITSEGQFDLPSLERDVDEKTRIVSFPAVSNVLGTIQDVAAIVKKVKAKNPKTIVIVDAAQAAGHFPIDVKNWDADFVAFSGHKMFGPTGIGVLYGKADMLEILPPVRFGGGMVLDACAPAPQYKEIPYRFEAGTPNISGAIGLAAAIAYIEKLGRQHLRKHELEISAYAQQKMKTALGESVTLLGPEDPKERGGVLAFTVQNIHPHDLAQVLGETGVCIRAGEHCAAPLHRSLKLVATARMSFSAYTTKKDIDALVSGIQAAQKLLT